MSYKELADYLDGLATGEFGTTHPKLANAAAILRSLDAQRPKVDEVMAQAQVFASAWALIGSRFVSGTGLEEAEQEKKDLRTAIEALAAPVAAQPQQAKPLSDAEIWADDGIMSANSRVGASFEALRELVRAVEKRYGIKEQG